jgi:hypothetical protein
MIERKSQLPSHWEPVGRDLKSANRLQQYLACLGSEALFYSTTSDAAERLPTVRQQWSQP